MKTLLVVNGENYWQEYFPDLQVEYIKIQHSKWVIKQDKLYVLYEDKVIEPDSVLWRVGAIKPTNIQEQAMRLIKLANVPCINSIDVLIKGFDRLSMLSEIKALDLPVISFNTVTHASLLKNLKQEFPFVVKAGNYHGGYGKVLVEDASKWREVQDLLFMSEDYVTVEPFIDYMRDIRYLAIADNVWAMARAGKYWKANVETTGFEMIEPNAELTHAVKSIQSALSADIIAIDVLEDKDGNYFIVEYNDIPGLSGFPESVKYALVDIVNAKIAC